MPSSAGGVIDTFKSTHILPFPPSTYLIALDLLRHGKHHNHARHENTPPPSAATDEQMSREAAEQIVKQEREQKEQMPTYKGLENFKIVEKMGESVPRPIFFDVVFIYPQRRLLQRLSCHRSHHKQESCRYVALIGRCFTNLISVAVKVVRKFELNASQVSVFLFFGFDATHLPSDCRAAGWGQAPQPQI
jgi:hypothetical protein